MLKSHVKFHSARGKRLVLVVDDEAVNRELLGLILSEEYEVVYAADGREALAKIREMRKLLSLVLLDLLMPGMHGLELLKIIREDKELQRIPVIVMTSEKAAEVESLHIGASDFITKPYDAPEVILARVRRTIELSEDTYIIETTERDVLTGLYNREYFYRYAEQFDQHHAGLDMDAIAIDINHFHLVNELYGKSFGDEVLRKIAGSIRSRISANDGIVCRREADTFLVYCPHREDYAELLACAGTGLTDENNRIRLRMGVYPAVDKSIDMERRFDRAKLAADTIRSNFAKSIAVYDRTLHEKELYMERLLEDVDEALATGQFKVFFQPKYDVRGPRPVLSSAEALVRWDHPQLGMVSPGVFIPLFEENGLIQRLDAYVWEKAAGQIRSWRETCGLTIPVSVNVSRVDLYDPHLTQTFRQLVEKNQLETKELLLEITESAYTEDSDQIIRVVTQLREQGFRVEMDDFGTGYSSLNMLTLLPIDALKLDMKFIHNIGKDGKDARMLELMIDIADYLSVPVIAEGVEDARQVQLLKDMGCHLIQGYYFSKPVPAEDFEKFIREERDHADN